MFTGIIEEIGTCVVLQEVDTSLRLLFSAEKVLSDLKVDDSIAVNGVCLTVTSTDTTQFEAWAVAETLKKTTLGSLKIGVHVNLERAATLLTRLGGHLVQGHIDGIATVKEVKSVGGDSWEFFFEVPQEYMHYIVPRGSIAINGVSLTVAEVMDSVIKIAIIPHTYSETIFQWLREGDKVNIELDIIAKMVERLMSK